VHGVDPNIRYLEMEAIETSSAPTNLNILRIEPIPEHNPSNELNFEKSCMKLADYSPLSPATLK
jgi:hypothetical protein